MQKDILYISGGKLNFKPHDGKTITAESEYLARYKDSLRQIKQKNEWKSGGISAPVYGYNALPDPDGAALNLNAICPQDENGYIYSASTDNSSGIFYRFLDKSKVTPSGSVGTDNQAANSADSTDSVVNSAANPYAKNASRENHIIHSNREVFGGLDYNAAAKKIAVSFGESSHGRQDIAVFEIEENNLKQITNGDSADENPSFSKCDDKIYYNSRGIGRDADFNMVRYSESSIFSIDERGGVSEVLTESGYDLIAPKDDAEGNLYYIKKPYSKPKQRGTGHLFLDILLLPFWLLYGTIYFLMFLAKVAKSKTNKQGGRSASDNPYLTPRQSEREILIHQERIDIAGEEKRNIRAGDKTAGFAPKSFQLWKMDKNGQKIKLKDKVLDFDVDTNGQIIYTNGKYIFDLPNQENTSTNGDSQSNPNKTNGDSQSNPNKTNGDSQSNPNKTNGENTEIVLIKDTLITKVKLNTPNQNPKHKPYSPF